MNILGLTSGKQRPGQAGTTGQLFFSKCGDPPKGCECKFEDPAKGNDPTFSLGVVYFAKLVSCQKYLIIPNSIMFCHSNDSINANNPVLL